MIQSRLNVEIVSGVLLLIATLLCTWLYCDHSSSSDFMLLVGMVAFYFVISLLLVAVMVHLLWIKRYEAGMDLASLSRACDRCRTICNITIILIIVFFGLSLAWTIFIIAALYFTSTSPTSPSVPFNGWRLLFYVAIAANLAFHLYVKREVDRRRNAPR